MSHKSTQLLNHVHITNFFRDYVTYTNNSQLLIKRCVTMLSINQPAAIRCYRDKINRLQLFLFFGFCLVRFQLYICKFTYSINKPLLGNKTESNHRYNAFKIIYFAITSSILRDHLLKSTTKNWQTRTLAPTVYLNKHIPLCSETQWRSVGNHRSSGPRRKISSEKKKQ